MITKITRVQAQLKKVSPVLPLCSQWYSRDSAPTCACKNQLALFLLKAVLRHIRLACAKTGGSENMWSGKEVKYSLQHESTLMLWLRILAELIYNVAAPEKISSGYCQSAYYNRD